MSTLPERLVERLGVYGFKAQQGTRSKSHCVVVRATLTEKELNRLARFVYEYDASAEVSRQGAGFVLIKLTRME